eukprot:TRINITY_DN6729_c0_g1_i1.p1 TRINITY_DN6729_c0_g1~~TRINITY_DN6729_c0_g1_i1.p1  ORF type:complete len:355 (-),score=35.29 TRINITY_DN6729_c0_g1_i1:107-1171(-)
MKVLLLLCFIAACFAAPHLGGAPIDVDGKQLVPVCGMEILSITQSWRNDTEKARLEKQRACPQENSCDDPTFRDQFSDSVGLRVRLKISLISDTCNSQATIDSVLRTIDATRSFFTNTQISLDFDHTQDLVCESSWDYNGAPIKKLGAMILGEWEQQLVALKTQFSIEPQKYLNIFISDMDSIFYLLLGIGTFPWMQESQTNRGGVWINWKSTEDSQIVTLAHEIGHNLGLWHAFHGVNEVAECSACWENVHAFDNAPSNLVGDRCADTLSAPQFYVDRNQPCHIPTGKNQCDQLAWDYGLPAGERNMLWDNVMAYTGTHCQTNFSPNQINRAKCNLCSHLNSFLSETGTYGGC